MKRLFLAAFAMGLLIAPAMAKNDFHSGGQHDVDHDRAVAGRQDAAAARDAAAGHTAKADQHTAQANATRADIGADLAGCPTCH